ncbi:Anti-sigma B factor RsbT [Chitinispirillum alkaliphilum]|nr:Anti-sigma B factor RsbT [Chitinispirillum alkaliphilum]
MTVSPLGSTTSSLLTLEIIFKLKIRDVMSSDVVSAVRTDTLRHVQHLMKTHRISGVPIAENGRIFGLISVDNILRALDFGYIDDTVEAYMTRNLMVLEEEMPLSIAISWFEKYQFGRFPVIDNNETLTGILTSRDIISKLLSELNRKIDQIESSRISQNRTDLQSYYREFNVKKYDFKSGGAASNAFRKVLKENGYPVAIIRRVAITCYELEINMVAHSDGGKLCCLIENGRIEIIARDCGPGIKDIDKAMTEGFSTASEWIRSLGFGAGMGLPNAKKSCDEFDIRSQPGLGTVVKGTVYFKPEKDKS